MGCRTNGGFLPDATFISLPTLMTAAFEPWGAHQLFEPRVVTGAVLQDGPTPGPTLRRVRDRRPRARCGSALGSVKSDTNFGVGRPTN